MTKTGNSDALFREKCLTKNRDADKSGTAWKPQLRKDINSCIKSASTYEEFLLLLRAKGYEIKGEEFGENAPKYISFRPLGKERFIRGSVKSLGKEYTKERIRERIEMNYPGASPQASFATTAHPCLDASDTCLSPRSARSRKRGI